ncbi:UNVERIFIED_CONTAM: putative mitochondrial protein [Sesamum calycinum]|uniref:Mitochondrial protein n=1 Tax=Sesamum calycinum TaxID=2727403 RepID=A0AAW2PQ41_9LAMI
MVDGDAHIRLWKRIQDCRVGLLQWNRVELEQPRREIKQLEERYAHLEGSELDATTHQEMMNIKARLAENEVREMLCWQQRSKEHWLANGDGNTRFFHSQASAHKRFKTITKLKNSEGNHMKGIMDSIVSPSQSAFIPGRLITDNVLLAFELNHYLKAPSRSNNASVALKLDMSKAYDRVEWPFLRYILLKLVLRVEAFSCMLQEVERRGGVQGVAVCAAAPKISHLLFADDTLLFCKVKGEKIEEIQRILTIYERASRQVVNFSKSNMVISGRIGEEEKQRLANRLGVRDRMWTRIADGIVAGKGVLIKPTRMGGLGFRSLKNFNLALLVKQGWRLLTQPNTMLSRVLKAKYFPHCSFWEASKGSRPSLTWRSLLATKEILREGCGVQNEEDAQDGTQFIWKQGSKGLFSVKSAYELVTELEARTEASTSGSYPRLT